MPRGKRGSADEVEDMLRQAKFELKHPTGPFSKQDIKELVELADEQLTDSVEKGRPNSTKAGQGVQLYNTAMQMAKYMKKGGDAKKIYERAKDQIEMAVREGLDPETEGELYEPEIMRTVFRRAAAFIGLSVLSIAILFARITGSAIGNTPNTILGALAIIFGIIALYFVFKNH